MNNHPLNTLGRITLLITIFCGLVLLGGCGSDSDSGDTNATNPANVPSQSNSSMALARVILPGAECAAGGIQIDSGIDENGNGVLDAAEIDTSEIICNGTNGTDGLTALVDQTAVSAGVACATGGVRFDVGMDTNGNGILDASEINSSEFLCNNGAGNGTGGGANTESPVIVSAISISNTEVVVQFSESMLPADAENPVNYDINGEEQGAALPVWDAIFHHADNSTVLLSTFSQSGIAYELTVSNMRDADGNPIAEPTILIDPSSTSFSGTEPSGITVADSDGDTLPDHVELFGWDITITYGNDTTETRHVSSDPGDPNQAPDAPINMAAQDTDSDGVTDNEERHGGMDPRQPDTDGDTLTDNQEWNNIYSDPTQQDTDGDGTQDGFEFYSYRTSPVLADTDGDQINDTDEILAQNRDPRISDLPRYGIIIGDVRLQIDERFTFEDVQGQTVTTDSSSNVTLTSGDKTSSSSINSKTTEKLEEKLRSLALGFEPGVTLRSFIIPTSINLQGDNKNVVTNTELRGINLDSALESQRVHAESLAKANTLNTSSTVTREVVGARIDADITIENLGDLAFTISNLEITVLQRSRESSRRFIPVATLIPNSTLINGSTANFNLGPFTPVRGPVLFGSRDVFANLVEELMQAPPGALVFEVANFDITDEFGRVFSFTSQTARDRTAGIIIDFGDGEIQRHLVATALQPDMDGLVGPVRGFVGGFNSDGSPIGIPIDFALRDILKLTKNSPDVDSITAGLNGIANTIAAGDDVQLIPPLTTGLGSGDVVVSAGQNGLLETTPLFDDSTQVSTGYETSLTCSADSGSSAGNLCSSDLECNSGGTGSCTGPDILVRFGKLRTGDFNRQWVVLSTGQVPTGGDFDQIILKPGEDIYFSFIQDLDRDGLFAREELLSGSIDSDANLLDNGSFGSVAPILGVGSEIIGYELNPPTQTPDEIPDSADTDRDGLSDFAEVRVGWTVSADGGALQQVFPSPRLADSDGDKLLDLQERDLRIFCLDDPENRTDGLCAFRNDPIVTQLDAIAIIAGPNGQVDTGTLGDDEQLLGLNTSGLSFGTAVIGPGPNGQIESTLNTNPGGDDLYVSVQSLSRPPPATSPFAVDTDADGLDDFRELHPFFAGTSVRDGEPGVLEEIVVAGADGIAKFIADPVTDDVQEIFPFPGGAGPPGGLPFDAVVVSSGPNGIIDTSTFILGIIDDQLLTRQKPGNGLSETRAIGDDIQQAFFNGPVVPNGIVVLPGPNGRIDSCSQVLDPVGGDGASCGVGDDHYTRGVTVVTDPLRRDTDSDLVADGVELERGGNPSDPTDGAEFRDSDQDGLSDTEESELGWLVVSNGALFPRLVLSNPSRPDSDFDGLPDFAERLLRTDPNDTDTDGDGLTDFDELADFEQFFGLDAQFAGFSVDGAASQQYGSDPLLADTDSDSLSDFEELLVGYQVLLTGEASFRTIFTNPLTEDTDLDGRTDAEERGAPPYINSGPTQSVDTEAVGDDVQEVPLGFAAPQSTAIVSAGANGTLETTPKGDDKIVLVHTTDATNPDTDGDGRSDGVEFANGTDPLVRDIGVTVTFGTLLVDQIEEGLVSGPINALSWLLTVKKPGDPELGNGQLVAETRTYEGTPAGLVISNLAGHGACWYLPAFSSTTTASYNLNLDESPQPFTLQEGQSFDVKGMIWEYDSTSDDCGNPPYFIPAVVFSGCLTRFDRTFSYDDLVNGGRIEFTADATETTDACSWFLDVVVEGR